MIISDLDSGQKRGPNSLERTSSRCVSAPGDGGSRGLYGSTCCLRNSVGGTMTRSGCEWFGGALTGTAGFKGTGSGEGTVESADPWNEINQKRNKRKAIYTPWMVE